MLSKAQTNLPKSSLRRVVKSAHPQEAHQGYQVSDWLSAKEKHHRSLQTISYSHLKRLFTVLPTRRGDKYRSIPELSLNPPSNGTRIPLGSHLTILPDKYDNASLRRDGLPNWHAPPPPFDYRRWVGGSFIFSAKTPPVVGMNFIAKTLSLHSKDLLHDPIHDDIVRVRQLSTVTQWYPEPTALIIEDREFHYHSKPFIPLNVGQFRALSSGIERVPCFDFNISYEDVTKFCEISQETHRIYSSPKFARFQGYRGLPIPISFQLSIILDTLSSFIPENMTCRGIDYLVINTLTIGSDIRIYRHWMSNDDGTASLAELAQHTAPATLNTPVDKRVSEDIFRRKQSRQTKIVRRALFWTENSDGQVGMVVLAILVTDSPSLWSYQAEKKFISLKQELGEGVLPGPMKEKSSITYKLDKDHTTPDEGFDPLGRPIKSDIPETRETNVRDSWSARDSIARSRNLLHRLFSGDDDNDILD